MNVEQLVHDRTYLRRLLGSGRARTPDGNRLLVIRQSNMTKLYAPLRSAFEKPQLTVIGKLDKSVEQSSFRSEFVCKRFSLFDSRHYPLAAQSVLYVRSIGFFSRAEPLGGPTSEFSIYTRCMCVFQQVLHIALNVNACLYIDKACGIGMKEEVMKRQPPMAMADPPPVTTDPARVRFAPRKMAKLELGENPGILEIYSYIYLLILSTNPFY